MHNPRSMTAFTVGIVAAELLELIDEDARPEGDHTQQRSAWCDPLEVF